MCNITNKLPPPWQKPVLSESDKPTVRSRRLQYRSHQIEPCWRRVSLRARQTCESRWLSATVWRRHSCWPRPPFPIRTNQLISHPCPAVCWVSVIVWMALLLLRDCRCDPGHLCRSAEHLSTPLIQTIFAWFSSVLKCKCSKLHGNKSLLGFLGSSVMGSQQESCYQWERD